MPDIDETRFGADERQYACVRTAWSGMPGEDRVMTDEELRTVVQRGEDQRTEFKAAEADAADISRAIVALANSGGGTILLGVGDDGEVLGLWYDQPSHIAVPRMEGIRRVDVPEYPDDSVREAIANAVAHRDWSLEGAKVRLFMFDDRLELWSPGKLPRR